MWIHGSSKGRITVRSVKVRYSLKHCDIISTVFIYLIIRLMFPKRGSGVRFSPFPFSHWHRSRKLTTLSGLLHSGYLSQLSDYDEYTLTRYGRKISKYFPPIARGSYVQRPVGKENISSLHSWPALKSLGGFLGERFHASMTQHSRARSFPRVLSLPCLSNHRLRPLRGSASRDANFLCL